MKTIVDRIIKIQNEIQNIKTYQGSQADSYVFYKYISDNLYPNVSGRYAIIKARFIPRSKNTSNIVCNFFPVSNQLLFTQGQDMSNPLEYYMRATFDTSPGMPNDVYISCISSVPGDLQITTRII